MKGEVLDRDGIGLRVLRTDTGRGRPTVLFANAVGMRAELLAPLAAQFDRIGYGFVTWELRGSPGPSRDPHDCAVGTHAADGAYVADRLGLEHVHLAGWCTGGSVGLFLLDRLGDRVRSFTSVDGAYLFDGVPGGPLGNAMFAMCRDIEQDEGTAPGYHELTRPRGQEAQVLGLADPRQVDLVTEPYRRGVDGLVRYALAIRAACAYDAGQRWSAVRLPTLVLARRDDRMVSYRNSVRCAGLVPGARLELRDTGGHYGLLTDDAVVTGMAAFLADVDGGAPGAPSRPVRVVTEAGHFPARLGGSP